VTSCRRDLHRDAVPESEISNSKSQIETNAIANTSENGDPESSNLYAPLPPAEWSNAESAVHRGLAHLAGTSLAIRALTPAYQLLPIYQR